MQKHGQEKAVLVVAEAALLIPPSSVCVEWSFSLMNLIETRVRNKMGEDRLNMHLHIKINTPDILPPKFLRDAAMLYLAKERRGLQVFLSPRQRGTLDLAKKIMIKHQTIWEAAEAESNKRQGEPIVYEGYGRFENYKLCGRVDDFAFSFYPPVYVTL
jgi:hypothetical protein